MPQIFGPCFYRILGDANSLTELHDCGSKGMGIEIEQARIGKGLFENLAYGASVFSVFAGFWDCVRRFWIMIWCPEEDSNLHDFHR